MIEKEVVFQGRRTGAISAADVRRDGNTYSFASIILLELAPLFIGGWQRNGRIIDAKEYVFPSLRPSAADIAPV